MPSPSQALPVLPVCRPSQRERESLDPAIIDTLWLSPAQLRGRAAELRSALVLAGLADYEAGVRHPLTLLHPLP